MNYDITIIGAGIVGLATAYSLLDKKPDLKLLVLEKEDGVSRHQTGNNSGVIHSGIYYKPGSLKASNCRRGYNMLLGFCDKHNIEYDICGKVIVATSEDEIPSLMNIYKRGNENGLEGLKILSAEEIKEIEPHTAGVKGILVPQTGIIDFKIVSEKLANLITERSGEIKFNSPIENIKINEENVEVSTPGNTYSSKYLIACGGLQSDRLAEMTNPEINIRIIPFRGEYYELKNDKRHLVKNLIYPVPDPAFPFLGVHFTRMIGGAVEAGPNAVLSFKREGYSKTSFSLKDTLVTFVWPGFRKMVMKY